MKTRRIVVRKDGPLRGWTVFLDDRQVSHTGVPSRKVGAWADGLEWGLRFADPTITVETTVENDYGARQVAVQVAKSTSEIAFSLLPLAVALYAIVNLFELVRIATTDWNALTFAELLAIEAVSVAFVFLVGSGRLRLPWDRRNRVTRSRSR